MANQFFQALRNRTSTKRIHVVGSSPRTGTTLMVELLVSSYVIDGFAEHEMSIFETPSKEWKVFCSKLPGDLINIPVLLKFDSSLYVINMLRDPRDVIVSRHSKAPDKYWVHLGVWKHRIKIAKKLANHPRFLNVHYEELVLNPAKVQKQISAFLPFLEQKSSFTDFHLNASPSQQAEEALGGTRPINSNSVNNWLKHKPRVIAQIERYGSIDFDLQEFGYEKNSDWRHVLDGIIGDNGETYFNENAGSKGKKFRESVRRGKKIIKYFLNR